eukprot:CAMPEP_0119426548 /NCGR_PEP_ID=MMETSP1335-20130426/36566_1 /TAXON_ID=259385 /ORGANISM="Chrysoculter rhomboideus, Strain RCC1486" /LENGTH=158 /DNA_ID=CAMNT_0007452143 /DNA_START=69 /DNA_END=543 /DNA_ORIENTATION=-
MSCVVCPSPSPHRAPRTALRAPHRAAQRRSARAAHARARSRAGGCTSAGHCAARRDASDPPRLRPHAAADGTRIGLALKRTRSRRQLRVARCRPKVPPETENQNGDDAPEAAATRTHCRCQGLHGARAPPLQAVQSLQYAAAGIGDGAHRTTSPSVSV